MVSVNIISHSLFEASIATSLISQINLKRVSKAVKGIEITLLTLKFIVFIANPICTAYLYMRDKDLNEYLNMIFYTSKYLGNNNLYIISSAFVFCQALLTFVLFIPSEVIAFKFITCLILYDSINSLHSQILKIENLENFK